MSQTVGYNIKGIWGRASTSELVLVGEAGTIAHHAGSLATGAWSSSHQTSATLRGIWGASITDVVAVGDNGTILRRVTESAPCP